MSYKRTYYDLATGEPKFLFSGSGDHEEITHPDGYPLVLGYLPDSVDVENEFVDPVTVTKTQRPIMGLSIDKTTILADAVDFVTFSGIPPGATVFITNSGHEDVIGGDGIYEFATDTPGDYGFRVTSYPYKDEVVWINAN